MRRIALPAALVAVAVFTAAATVGTARWLDAGPSASRADCTHRLPAGNSVDAAHEATALFVRTVVLREQPRCGYALGSDRLRGEVGRARWIRGDTPVKPFASRFPATAYRDASPNPLAPQAVYVISRSTGASAPSPLVMIVGLAAPDAGLGAYRIRLVLDREANWRVDDWWRVRISSRDL